MRRIQPIELEYAGEDNYDFSFASRSGNLKFRFEFCEIEAGLRGIKKVDTAFNELTFDDVSRDLIVSAVLQFDEARQHEIQKPISISYLGQGLNLAQVYRVALERSNEVGNHLISVFIEGKSCYLNFAGSNFEVLEGPRGISILKDGLSESRALLQCVLHIDESRYYRASADDEVFRLELRYQPTS
jgi:hypothetical protein